MSVSVATEVQRLLPLESQLWAEVCRMMMAGHMRRGESDLVAHWMLQVMALDPAAPEWGHVLGAGTPRGRSS